MDAWFEEDEEVFVHPRDPHHRVDVLRSSRHVRVRIDGELVADSARPCLLFETGMPTRYYLPRADVRMELLSDTGTRTQCPYKGIAGYFAATVGGQRHDDIAWTYAMPVPECPKIEQLVCFFNEKVETEVDGVVEAPPATKWTTGHPRPRPGLRRGAREREREVVRFAAITLRRHAAAGWRADKRG